MSEVICPRCGSDMRLRNGIRGKFYGCSDYPACRGTREYAPGNGGDAPSGAVRGWGAVADQVRSDPAATGPAFDPEAPVTLIKGTPEQEAFWDALKNGSTHIMLSAVAGSGKTFSIVQGVMRLPRNLKIGVLAFNSHIAKEMNWKLKEANVWWVKALTYNSLGYRSVRSAFPNVQLLDDKLETIAQQFVSDADADSTLNAVIKTARLCKCYLYDGKDRFQIEELLDRHDIEYDDARRIQEIVPRVLAKCLDDEAVIDFDDQCWWPVVRRLPVEQFDLLLVDEAQDTNKMQQELAFRACPRGRIVVVGDPNQAIYGFRGADVRALPALFEALSATGRGCTPFPLTLTRRCPKAHTALARAIVPQIHSLDDAPEGEVLVLSENAAIDRMTPGDLVLCRTNAPLISPCYSLIRRGVKAMIRGRDIGKGLLALVNKWKVSTISALLTRLTEYEQKEMAKLSAMGKKAEKRIQALQDRVMCITELCEGVDSITKLKAKIDRIFSDFDDSGKPKDAVVFGTVHRTKGLEAHSVYILHPELIPHPMASQVWEVQQEYNLAYVAATRAKYEGKKPGTLVFIGEIPPIFTGPPPSPEQAARDAVDRKSKKNWKRRKGTAAAVPARRVLSDEATDALERDLADAVIGSERDED